MMNKSRSAKIQLTRFLFLFPLLSVMLLAFRSNVIDKIRLEKVQEHAQLNLQAVISQPLIFDTLPAPAKNNVRAEFLKKNSDIKDIGWEAAGKAEPSVLIVFRRDGIVEKYDWEDVKARSLFQKRYGSQPDLPKNFVAKSAFSFGGVEEEVVDASLEGPRNPYLRIPNSNILITVNGEIKEKNFDLNSIDANSIKRMNVLKGESAVAVYGDVVKGMDGVIEIETKDYNVLKLSGRAATISPNGDSAVFEGNPTIKVRGRSAHMVKLYIVDGIEFGPAEFEKLNIEPNRIESITVLKNESATKLYGEKGREGVIIITLKKVLTNMQVVPKSKEDEEMSKSPEEPIRIVDGSTYAYAGGARGSMSGVVNTVIVNDKIYTPEEANRLFKRVQFSGVMMLTPDHTFKVHGIREAAVVLTDRNTDHEKYNLDPQPALR